MPKRRSRKGPVAVEATTHPSDKRLNIPTAEYESIVPDDERQPRPVRYRRNRDLDPQLVWRGKDEQDWSDLVVPAPPLYIQEKVQPKALVDDLLRETKARRDEENPPQPTLFGDFNGLPEGADRTEFYQHHGNWSNRMILGDSLRVMASLAEREGYRGKVQCIYFDPPYGIKFNSNFQWSTTSRDVKDGKQEHISREPEQVKAFRDTWRDGIHSYLTYLRDRLTVARDLLTESGSIFVQIGDENVHRVRAVMDEVLGPENFVAAIAFATTTSQTSTFIPSVFDSILWFSKDKAQCRTRNLLVEKDIQAARMSAFALFEANHVVSRRSTGLPDEELLVYGDLTSRSGPGGASKSFSVFGFEKRLATGSWKTNPEGLARLGRAGRIGERGRGVFYKRYFRDSPCSPMNNMWRDTQSGGIGRESKTYVVQTNPTVIARCVLMTTEPGDLVLDPTCGSGTTAYVAEQWGRRWITMDTSRVALALARSRIMGARYPYYTLADSPDGQREEARLSGSEPKSNVTYGDIRHGFVNERVPHITLKAIANNTEIDAIWEQRQPAVTAALAVLNETLQSLSLSLSLYSANVSRHTGCPQGAVGGLRRAA